MRLSVLIATTALIIGTASTAKAQVGYIPPTARPYAVGISGGLTKLHTNDLREYHPYRPAAKLNLDYNYTYFITVGLEYQYGQIETGDRDPASITYGMGGKNTFLAGNVNAKVSVGQFTQSYNSFGMRLLNGLYGGLGVGVILSNVKDLETELPNGRPVRNYKENTQAITFPFNAGWNIILPRLGKNANTNLTLNINYQYNYALGDYLDGYNLLLRENAGGRQQRNDKYSLITAGLRYNFGRWK